MLSEAIELRDPPNYEGQEDTHMKPAVTPETAHSASITSDTHPVVDNNLQKTTPDDENTPPEETREKHGIRFWCIIFVLCMTSLLSSLEGTIISTALPSIASDLGGKEHYIWAVNGYFLTSMVFQPLYGQTANIWGRKNLMLFATVVFLIGCAICGASQNMSMLIAGRAIQGIGGGGLSMLTNLVVSDIVPLRERGTFMAYLFVTVMVGSGIGPYIGGVIVQNISWRWVFLMNLPIGGVTLILTIVFLQVNYTKEPHIWQSLRKIDYIGNAIFVPSLVAILLALTWGGTTLPWSSWRVILPLCIGFGGLGLFSIFESSKFCLNPTIPPRLFRNRTTVAVFVITFLQTTLVYWIIYYLPVYFQAVYGSTPSRSGVQLLPFVFIMVPSALVSGKLLTRFGKYCPFHWIGFSLAIIGLGCFTLLGPTSSTAEWVCFQAIAAAGLGCISGSALPAILAPLSQKDVAAATGTWSFLRSFGIIWGVSISGAIFNNQFSERALQITDPATKALLLNGGAYEHATKAFINSFSNRPALKAEIIADYTESLQRVWQVAIGIAGLAFLMVFVEKDIPLRTNLETEFGIKKKKTKSEEGRQQLPES